MEDDVVHVESREIKSQARSSEEGEWGHAKGSGVPLREIDGPSRENLA